MLVCLPARVDDGDDIGKSINPRPQWAWPARHGPVTEVAAVLGVKYSTSCFLDLDVDRLRWFGDEGRRDKRGWLELRRCDVHADVSRIHGRETPVLELCYGGRVLKLRFASLDDMSAWWSDLSATQELLARLDAEEGRAPVDDDDRDDLEPTATPATPDTPRRARNEFHVDLARGAFEPQLFLSIRRAYEQVLGMIIRPPRAKYDVRQLGPASFAYGAARGARAPPYVRDDFFVANARGLRVACSLWRPAGPSEVTQAVVGRRASCLLYDEKLPLADSPTLIYLHGNASCRVEACTTLSLCCGLGLSVCAIDCSGSGASDGEYISLGLYEAEDVVAVVDHLKRDYGLNRYGLWGRSMGSVTALLYASGKAPDAACRAGQESEIPNFKGSYLGRFPLVSADFWTSDHLLERSRSVDAFPGTRARGTLTLKRR